MARSRLDDSVLDDRVRLLSFAHINIGRRSVREISDLLKIDYLRVVKFKQQYDEAVQRKNLYEMMKIDKESFELLVAATKEQDQKAMDTEIMSDIILEGEVVKLGESVSKLAVVETTMQDTALIVLRQIQKLAVTTTSSDSMLNLAEAVTKLQGAFFGKNIKIEETGSKFERFLTD